MEVRSKRAIVIFSGGQDSTTCLAWAKNRFKEVETITFSYGQRHSIELECAKKIASILGVKNSVFEIDIFKRLGDSSLISGGDLNSSHAKHPNLPSSYVPNRNALMFTIAHAYAQKVGFDALVTGVGEVDFSGYPDCREEFVLALESALNIGSESNIKFYYPLMRLNKAEIFKLAQKEGVLDVVIKESHTCYKGDRSRLFEWGYGCGECPACRLREKGWREYLLS